MNKGASAIYFTLFDEFFKKSPTKSERRKLQIVEKTIHELATRGLDATTHESVALACGITRALVQHYFPDRDELLLLAFRFVRAKFQKICVDEIAKKTTPAEQLKVYVETACSWQKFAPLDAKVWVLFYYYCGIKKKYRSLNSELVNQGHVRIESLLQAISENKAGATSNSYSLPAKLIQNTITSFYLSSITEDHDKKFNEQLYSETVALCLKLAGISA